jgi:hypothetical protein
MATPRLADRSRARMTLPVRREPGVAAAVAHAAAPRTMPPPLPSTQHERVGEALKQGYKEAAGWSAPCHD